MINERMTNDQINEKMIKKYIKNSLKNMKNEMQNIKCGEGTPLRWRNAGMGSALRYVGKCGSGGAHSATFHAWCVGFTLAEVVIGVAILSIVLIGITTLTITSIRANEANIHRLTAYYLAQEGLEGVRTIRDSNWLQNYTWNEGRSLEVNFSQEGYYSINYVPTSTTEPFQLTWLGTEESTVLSSDLDPNPIQLYWVGDSTRHFYMHWTDEAMAVSFSGSEVSPYKRYLHVMYPNVSEDVAEVTVVMLWEEHGNAKSMEVSTRLSDWKEGPL